MALAYHAERGRPADPPARVGARAQLHEVGRAGQRSPSRHRPQGTSTSTQRTSPPTSPSPLEAAPRRLPRPRAPSPSVCEPATSRLGDGVAVTGFDLTTAEGYHLYA